jgi:polysaccharide export outer membrane protein
MFYWKFIAMKRMQAEREGGMGYFSLGACPPYLWRAFFLLFLALSSGCGNKFFDPTQVGRFRPVPAVNVILDSLGVAEETPVAWEGAQEPRPGDVVAVESDYVFRSGDIVRVAVFELLQEGVYFINDYVVTETGKISIPEVGVVEVSGLTETQLEEEIRRILSPSILKEPSVTVTLVRSQQYTFSILGDGVSTPSRYVIPRYDFRLTDALAMAGGSRQFNVSYIYVSRSTKDKEKRNKRSGPEAAEPWPPAGELELIRPGMTVPKSRKLETAAPRTQYRWPESKVVITSSEMVTDREVAQSPESFERFSSSTRSREDIWAASAAPVNSNRTMDEPVSVKDVLKTLSQRSRQARAINETRPYEQRGEQQEIEEVLRPFWGPSGRERKIDEPRLYQERGEQAEIEEVLKPFWGSPAGSQGSARRDKRIDEQAGVGDVFKSLGEPSRRRSRIDEQAELPDTLGSSVSPVAPKVMDKQLSEGEAGRIEWIFRDGKWVSVQAGQPKPTEEEAEAGHIEWIFRNGKWVPVKVTPPKPTEPLIKVEPEKQLVGPFRERAVPDLKGAEVAETRLIKIQADKLLAGDPRYNVVIKPGDTIYVPVDIVGEFCIMGNVNRTGFIPITGRPMTLKMAIAAAGGLGPLAWPRRCEVIRRVERKREEIVMVDLDKIASGEQPDFFIKPNDLINVGTHATARWRAVLRNAYRATYGFGFVYDRNFADRDFYSESILPSLSLF